MVFRRNATKGYIDEYLGEHITAENAEEMDKKLDDIGDSAYRTYVSGKLVIDSLNPTDCYARYANDPREDYNAKLIVHAPTKSAEIVAIKDIYADDEIVVNYHKKYWKGLKPVRGLNKLQLVTHSDEETTTVGGTKLKNRRVFLKIKNKKAKKAKEIRPGVFESEIKNV